MVAVIKSGRSVRATFHYNENKVKEGIADCLMAANYPLDLEDLSEQMRLNRILKMAERSDMVKRPSIHISLNFAPEEQHSPEFLKQLAAEYMERIGFGSQPYLMYRHYDAGHPHIHILTTKVKANGHCIDTNYIGRKRSEPARKEMEIKYGLVKAEDHKKEMFEPKAINAATVAYGKVSTKRAISSILSSVIDRYKYTSLAELNAVLRLYNVCAERGDEDSRLYKNKGLVYRVLGADGRPVSTPIKASAFHQKAKLKDIEGRFLRNDVDRHAHKNRVKVAIDWKLRAPGTSLEKLIEGLKSEGITVVPRFNADGLLYGITYVDHKSRCVFNGSDLGKKYSAASILERCGLPDNKATKAMDQSLPSKDVSKQTADAKHPEIPASKPQDSDNSPVPETDKTLLETLMQPENNYDNLPYELRKTRKKRKKRTNRL